MKTINRLVKKSTEGLDKKSIKKLSREDVLKLAKLANLTLTDEEIEKYKKQLEETIDYMKNLEELDTKNIKATNSVVDLENITYSDGTSNTKGLTQQEAVSNAKNIKNGAFIVERIMK